MNQEKLLRKLKEPIDGVFHGTYKKYLDSIRSTGLNRMGRQHIHMAKSFTASSGKRGDCDLIVYIDMKKAMEDGIRFLWIRKWSYFVRGYSRDEPSSISRFSFVVR